MGWFFTRGSNRRQLIEERDEELDGGRTGKHDGQYHLCRSLLQGRIFQWRPVGSLGTDLHQERRGSEATRTLGHMRPSPIPTGLWVGEQGHGGSRASILLLLPGKVSRPRPARNLRRLRGVEGGSSPVSRETT